MSNVKEAYEKIQQKRHSGFIDKSSWAAVDVVATTAPIQFPPVTGSARAVPKSSKTTQRVSRPSSEMASKYDFLEFESLDPLVESSEKGCPYRRINSCKVNYHGSPMRLATRIASKSKDSKGLLASVSILVMYAAMRHVEMQQSIREIAQYMDKASREEFMAFGKHLQKCLRKLFEMRHKDSAFHYHDKVTFNVTPTTPIYFTKFGKVSTIEMNQAEVKRVFADIPPCADCPRKKLSFTKPFILTRDAVKAVVSTL